MNKMKMISVAVFTVLLVTGCQHRPEASGGTRPPSPPPGYHLEYKSWSGASPGAGFMHTSLQCVELDLSKARIRRIWKSATRPEPMLPHDDASIAKLIAQAPWTELKPEQVDAYREAIDAWLKTSPPPKYNSPMALGSEDGHITSLSVTWGTNTVTTALNPRGGYRKDDPLNPPDEWRTLLELLIVVHKAPDGTLQPIRKK